MAKAFHLAVGSVLLLAAACASDVDEDKAADVLMPDVVGQQLDLALGDIEEAGVDADTEVDGGGIFGIVDESTWQVCDQSPAPGAAVTGAPRLSVDRSCGSGAEKPTEDRAGESETAPEEVLTIESSEALRDLLTGPAAGASVEAFADRYGGGKATIAFDGHIAYLLASKRVANSTAYIVAGDSGAPTGGPVFEITPLSLPPTSPMQQDELEEGQNVRLKAEVGYFEHHDATALTEEVNRLHLVALSVEPR